ncbi:MAG: ABC transporter permease, partial [Candidatus Hodarchaeales archaeon]
MLKLAIRNVKRSKWRTSLLIFGILVTIALETGIVVTMDTIYNEFLFDNRSQNYTDITVNPKTWMDLDSLGELRKVVSSVPGVSQASEVYYISSDLIQNQSGGLIDVLVYGINPRTHPDFPSLNMSEGTPIIEDKTILMSQSFKESLDIRLDDEIFLEEKPEIGFLGAELLVGGVFTIPPSFGNKDGQFIILVDIESIVRSFHVSSISSSLRSKIDVKVENFLKIKNVADRIKDTLGPDFNIYMEKEISELQTLGISAYSTAINLIILASLLMEFLFLTNILTISIRDRRKEYGILRTVGISSRQLLLTIFYEILIYSIIGIILGIMIGIGIANFLATLIDRYYSIINLQDLSIEYSSLTMIIISGLSIALLAGIYPLYLALKVPVIRNIHYRMRSSENTLFGSYWKYTLIFGTILAFSGFIFALYLTPTKFLDFSIFSGHFLVIVYIFLGTLLIEAGLLVFLPKIGEKLLIIFDIVPRQISMRNISREYHKSLFTLISSSVAITFIILLAIVSNVVIHNVPQYFDNQWGSIDLVVETYDNNPLPINFTDELVSNEMIKQASYIQESRISIGSINTNVYGVDPDHYTFFQEITYDKISTEPNHILLTKSTPLKINALVSDVLFSSL